MNALREAIAREVFRKVMDREGKRKLQWEHLEPWTQDGWLGWADDVLAGPLRDLLAERDTLAAQVRADVLAAVAEERVRQDSKWGEQNHPDGTGVFPRADRRAADEARRECQMLAAGGMCTWRAILAEEVAEAFAETDPDALRAELVQVAAVAVQWIQAIGRRALGTPTTGGGE